MFNKKSVITFISLCVLFTSMAWSSWTPLISRQKKLPENYEEGIAKLKEQAKEKKKLKKEKKNALQEKCEFAYMAHQKNRLIHFAEHDGFIWFNDKNNQYTYFLSNFYPTHLKIWDMKFSCAEGAFQAAKFLHKPEIAVRFTHLDGEKAAHLAQKLSYQRRGDWYQVREKVMLEVLRAKFQQHSELSELLLATGDAYIVDNNDDNVFWSDGGDGKGKNRLGQLLMQIREEKGGIGLVSKPGKYKKFVH